MSGAVAARRTTEAGATEAGNTEAGATEARNTTVRPTTEARASGTRAAETAAPVTVAAADEVERVVVAHCSTGITGRVVVRVASAATARAGWQAALGT